MGGWRHGRSPRRARQDDSRELPPAPPADRQPLLPGGAGPGGEAEPERKSRPRVAAAQLPDRGLPEPGLRRPRIGAGKPRPHAIPRIPRAGGRAAARHLRRPVGPVRPGRAFHRGPAAGRAEPRRQSRAGGGHVPRPPHAASRKDLRFPPRDSRRAPACADAPRDRRWRVRRSRLGPAFRPRTRRAAGPCARRRRIAVRGPDARRQARPVGVRGHGVLPQALRRPGGGNLRREHGPGHRRRAVGVAARALGRHGRRSWRAGAARRRAAVRVRRCARGGRRHHRPPAGRSRRTGDTWPTVATGRP